MKSERIVRYENEKFHTIPAFSPEEESLVHDTFRSMSIENKLQLTVPEIALLLGKQYAEFEDDSLGSLFGDPKTAESTYGKIKDFIPMAEKIRRHWGWVSQYYRPNFQPLNLNPYHVFQLLVPRGGLKDIFDNTSKVSGRKPGKPYFDLYYEISTLFCPLCHSYERMKKVSKEENTLYDLAQSSGQNSIEISCRECDEEGFEGLGSLFG